MAELAVVVAVASLAAVALYMACGVRDGAALLAALPALALGSLSLAGFGLLFADIALTPVSLTAAFLGILAYLALVTRRWRGADEAATDSQASRATAMAPAAGALLGASVVFLAWAGRLWIRAWPHGSADAVNIWTSRALFLARADGDMPARLATMSQGHPDYPLMLPAAVAAQYGLSGSESLVIPQATSVLWLVAVVAATFAVTTRLSNATVGALAAAAVAVNPLLIRWGFAQCADVAIAYLLLLFASGLATARAGTDLFPPPLVGFFAGLLMWTKPEGTVVGAALMIVAGGYCMLRPGDRTERLRYATSFGLGSAPPLIALVALQAVWLRGVETPSFLRPDWLERITDVDRWRLLLSTAAYEATFPGRMRVSAALVLVAAALTMLIVIARRGRVPTATAILLAPAALAVPIYATAYMLSPYDLLWHVSTSVDRLLLQVMPALMAGTALLLAPRELDKITRDGRH